MSTYETELGEFGETEFGETEFGEFGELGEAEFGEFGEFGETTEFGELGETEFGETGEFGETEFGEFGETSEYGEAEQFLGGILGSLIGGGEVGSPLSEAQEIELASELLEISNEQELEQFLGNVFKSVARGVGGLIKSPVGRALGGILKNVAKRALPVVGGALGSMVAPGIGTALGSKLGSMASGLFEVELESMPQEQAEYEAARRLVNLAATSAAHAARARPRPGVSPQTVARAAVAAAARTYAPGVYRAMMNSLRSSVPAAPGRRQNSMTRMRAGAPGYRRPGPGVTGRPAGARNGGPAPRYGRPMGYPERPRSWGGPGAQRPGMPAPQRPGGQWAQRPGTPTPGRPGTQAPPRPGMPAPQRPGGQWGQRPGMAWGQRWYEPWSGWGAYEPGTAPTGVEGAPGGGDVYGPARSGRWVRHGRKIVVYGA